MAQKTVSKSKDIVLAGRIIKIRRVPKQAVKNPLDAVINVEDVLRGSLRSTQLENLDVIFHCSEERKTAYKTIFRNNSLCFMYGAIKRISGKSVFVVDDFIGTDKAAVDIAKSKLNEDPNILRSLVVNDGGFALASRPGLLTKSKELISTEIMNTRKWLVDHNLPFDLDTAWSITLFFQMRAERREKNLSVLGLIKKNPLMLADFSADLPVSKLRRIFSGTKDINISPEMELLARISETLFRASKKGHSCMPLSSLNSFYPIKQLLNDLGVPQDERSKKITELIFQKADYRTADVIIEKRNIEPFLPDIKKDFREQMKDSEGLSKEELHLYNRRKIIPTWLVDHIGSFAYLPKLFHGEKNVAKALYAHVQHGVKPIKVKKSQLKNLTDQQIAAIEIALSRPVSVIVGNAGTGKTYVIHRLKSIVQSSGHKVFILAPTATAAANAGHGGSFSNYFTIHRFAKISLLDEDLGTTESMTGGSLESISDGDFVVIDEMSMCTLPVINTFFKTIGEALGAHIVLVGDDQQLPAIGANIFHTFSRGLYGDDIPVTRLTVNQRSENNLVKFTNKIRAGQFSVSDCEEIHLVSSTAISFFHSHVDLMKENNVLVLTATHACQQRLNDMLRGLINEDGKQISMMIKDSETAINTGFCVGDPIVAIRNDYYNLDENEEEQTDLFLTKTLRHPDRKTNIYNGTFGTIESFLETKNTVFIRLYPPEAPSQGILIPYTVEELSLLFEVAYAVTTHKAQGGERDIVVFVADSSNNNDSTISRSMLYTAATRAKKTLYLIGKQEYFEKATAKNEDMILSLLPYRYRMEKEFPIPVDSSQASPGTSSGEKEVWKPKKRRISSIST